MKFLKNLLLKSLSVVRTRLPILSQKLMRNPKALFILLVVVGVIAVYIFLQYQRTQSELEKLRVNPKELAAIETKKVVSQVSKLMVLPQKETPTLATVTDVNKLKTQPFFARAQNGDKVLIYAQDKKAILYRTSINKIIEVASINIGQTQAPETSKLELPQSIASPKPQQPQTSQAVKVVLYNGTKTVGITYTVEKQLKGKISNVEIIDKDNAKRDDYDKTIVIDISNKHQDIAEKLAKELSGLVGQLPEEEVKPENADILVILGKGK